MKHRRISSIAAALAAGLLAGCATSVPAPVLLTLPTNGPTAAAAAPAPAPSASAPLLAVRRVGIPEYLVSRRVRYRAEASTLAEWPNTYWAERIEIGVSREFVAALRPQLPGWELCDTSCGELVPTLTLQVEFAPMDYLRSAQKLQAHARVTISSAGGAAKPLKTLELNYDLPGAADSAQAQAQAIATLLRQVATATAPLLLAAPR
jgi:uncharacterized lipoprotein YmbA